MLKKIILTILIVLSITPVYAKSGVNIFTYPREVPDVKIFDRHGKAVSLKEFKGNFLIVVFWSKTCIPCIREIDDINNFIRKTKGTDIKIINTYLG
jgi:thiol-disulfide isomerase/thioredoxin